MDYTICSKVLEATKTNKSYLGDLLLTFCDSTSSNKVVKNKDILDAYNKIASDDMDIKSWITFMGYCSSKNWKNIENNELPIFIKTCLKTNDKKLIVSEKEDYTEAEYDIIIPINKDEAICEIKQAHIITVINQNGNNPKATTGNCSSIK